MLGTVGDCEIGVYAVSPWPLAHSRDTDGALAQTGRGES